MESRSSHFFPQLTEMVGLGFVAIMLMILVSSNQLLTYYGLGSTSQLLKDGLGAAISNGLDKIDGFGFTDSAVTFLIWAGVGLFCFSIVRGLANAYHELEFEKDLSSNRYIHPSTFRRSAFWKHVLGNFGLLVLSLALLGGVLYGLIGFVVPIAVIYGRCV